MTKVRIRNNFKVWSGLKTYDPKHNSLTIDLSEDEDLDDC